MKKIIILAIFLVSVVLCCFAIGLSNSILTTKSAEVCSENENNTIYIGVSNSYAYDITDINKLYENSDLIVTGSVSCIGQAKKNSTLPVACTPVKFQIQNTVKGSEQLNFIDVLVEGGTISMQEYYESMIDLYPKILEKENISAYSDEEKNNMYISYISDEYESLVENQSYILFLNELETTGEYVVISFSGMIPIEENMASSICNLQDIINISK